jgi:hypothetical protein
MNDPNGIGRHLDLSSPTRSTPNSFESIPRNISLPKDIRVALEDGPAYRQCMQIAAIAVTLIVLLIDLFTHRFQRATLAVANLKTEGNSDRQEIGRLQLAMTPEWIGHCALLEYTLAAVAAVQLYLAFQWWVLLALGVLYLGGMLAGLVGPVVPLMPHAWNLAVIGRHLNHCRLAAAIGERLPNGATDMIESLYLGELADGLREEFAIGKVSVERVAAGYLPK